MTVLHSGARRSAGVHDVSSLYSNLREIEKKEELLKKMLKQLIDMYDNNSLTETEQYLLLEECRTLLE